MLYIQTKDARLAAKRLGANLSAKEIAKAESRAINHALGKARTEARRRVKLIFNISQKDIGGIGINRSKANTLRGELYASQKPIPLDTFAPKQETGSRTVRITRRGEYRVRELRRIRKNPTAGVSIEILRGQREVIPYAFLIPGGAVRVFARGVYTKTGKGYTFNKRHHRVNKTGSDIPIRPLISLSPFGSVLNDQVITEVGNQAKHEVSERLVHEIHFIVNGRQGRGDA